jgi:O-acetylhomoserine (thiol)-lyase
VKLETLCIHAGAQPDPTTNARALPLYRSAAFVFNSTEHAANLFALRELGNIYSRLTNPTQDALEQRVAALEGGAAALAFASGTAAIFNSIINIAKSGDENTKALYCETLSNPAGDIADIEKISAIAHAHGIPLIVDATFTAAILQRPIDHGADIVIHSLTKWMGGQGTGIGGIVVDSGKFDWKSDKFPLMVDPEPSYHGVRWAYDLPDFLAPVAYLIRMRVIPLRNLGAAISPDNAWQFAQGIETLSLRMERHCQNANVLANYLNDHNDVESVKYPGLDKGQSELNKKYLNGFGGPMVVFEIKGGKEAGKKFIENLTMFSHLANVGDAKSLAIHPATTTHSQLTSEQQIAAGITPGLVRLSVGIEHIDDIIADIKSALAA